MFAKFNPFSKQFNGFDVTLDALLLSIMVIVTVMAGKPAEAKDGVKDQEPMRLVCLSPGVDGSTMCRAIRSNGWRCTVIPSNDGDTNTWYRCEKEDELPPLRLDPVPCHNYGCGIGCIELKPREHCKEGFQFTHNDTGAFCCPNP